MIDTVELGRLVGQFRANLPYYKDGKSSYNEYSCRIEYIDPLLKAFGWDVANAKGLPPQYREVIAENYSTKTDRPDYSMTLRGVAKFFVEAKKPAVDIFRDKEPAYQTRKYGWNLLQRIDGIVRKDDNIEAALDIVDQEILVEMLGIDSKWCAQCRVIWRKLQKRRLSRG